MGCAGRQFSAKGWSLVQKWWVLPTDVCVCVCVCVCATPAITYPHTYRNRLALNLEKKKYRGSDKSLARPRRKQANVSVRMAWIFFGVLSCRKKKNLTARVSMLLKSRASLSCFGVCFLPGRAKELSAPRYWPKSSTEWYWQRKKNRIFHRKQCPLRNSHRRTCYGKRAVEEGCLRLGTFRNSCWSVINWLFFRRSETQSNYLSTLLLHVCQLRKMTLRRGRELQNVSQNQPRGYLWSVEFPGPCLLLPSG